MLPRNIRTDGFVHPCAPVRAAKPPVGLGWVHEIKHDGYRLIVRRDGIAVRLFTRNGYDWTERYPAIAAAASKLLAKSFTLDGEAVVCGADRVAVFDALHRHGKVREAILQAFDLLELNGGLEGIVSKRLAAPYRSGPSGDWIKVKNPDSPAMVRHRTGRW
jgi:bifunctional non-homologous end joining protein LigD